jgi:2-polyprenyl-6-methoxyphenol hydroxylase-like FAD-dependent oxidoreductase
VARVRVAVAGAGLGGLCLAQGLRQAGAEVTVYERDDGLAGRRQGYRLHVDARAGLALQQCLPPELLAAFQATCGQASTRLVVVSERLRVLKEVTVGDPTADSYAPGTLSTSVNRLTLREVLAAGLDDMIVPGREVTGSPR